MLTRFALVLGWLLGPTTLAGQTTLDSAAAAPVGRLLARFDATASTARTSDAAGRSALFTDDAGRSVSDGLGARRRGTSDVGHETLRGGHTTDRAHWWGSSTAV